MAAYLVFGLGGALKREDAFLASNIAEHLSSKGWECRTFGRDPLDDVFFQSSLRMDESRGALPKIVLPSSVYRGYSTSQRCVELCQLDLSVGTDASNRLFEYRGLAGLPSSSVHTPWFVCESQQLLKDGGVRFAITLRRGAEWGIAADQSFAHTPYHALSIALKRAKIPLFNLNTKEHRERLGLMISKKDVEECA